MGEARNIIPLVKQNPVLLYDRAKTALAECHSIDECKDWRDKAAALEEYARQRDDPELMKLAHQIKGRAVRRIGQLLAEIAPARGGDRGNQYCQRDGDGPLASRKAAAQSAGLSERKAKEALRVANVEEQRFEESLAKGMPLVDIAAIGTEKRPLREIVQKVDPLALDLWGWFRDCERDRFIDLDHARLFGTMTEPMRRDIARIAPSIRQLISSIEEIINARHYS